LPVPTPSTSAIAFEMGSNAGAGSTFGLIVRVAVVMAGLTSGE
jgi:hypothetical protein